MAVTLKSGRDNQAYRQRMVGEAKKEKIKKEGRKVGVWVDKQKGRQIGKYGACKRARRQEKRNR